MMCPIFAVTTVMHSVTVHSKTAGVFSTYPVKHSQSPSYFLAQQRQVNAEEEKKRLRTILFSITRH